jgi:hypothetical protein
LDYDFARADLQGERLLFFPLTLVWHHGTGAGPATARQCNQQGCARHHSKRKVQRTAAKLADTPEQFDGIIRNDTATLSDVFKDFVQ